MSYLKHTFFFTLISYITWQCKCISCPYQQNCGPCTADGKCTLDCQANSQCQNAHLTCKDGEDCDINCKSSYLNVCQGATIDASNAINVAIGCDWTDSCNSATVQCGTGSCIITCDQQNSCTNMVVDATKASYLRINCWLTNSCNGIDVTCGSGTCFMNCGGSTHGQDHCTSMQLDCGTSDCSVNCNDAGYRQCNSITVDAASANSFTCTGGSTQCSSAPDSFTAPPTTDVPTTIAPTTYNPTIYPTTYQPTTYQPTTYQPTTYQPSTAQPTTKPTMKPTTHSPTKASVSVEIPIVASNATNVTIKDTITEIINEYLHTHLSANSNFSLSVDIVHNKVIVTITSDDISTLDTTQLISYVDVQLLGTDVRVDIMETTSGIINKIEHKNKGDNGMSGAVIVVIVIAVLFAIILLMACICWYRRYIKTIYDEKTVIRVQLSELQRKEKMSMSIKTAGAVKSVSSIHQDNTMLSNESDNTDSFEELNNTINTEGTRSTNMGELMHTNKVDTGTDTNTNDDDDDDDDIFDDTDVLHEINNETKGGYHDGNNMDDDMIITDENHETAGLGQNDDDDIMIVSNDDTEGEITTDEYDSNDMNVANMMTIN